MRKLIPTASASLFVALLAAALASLTTLAPAAAPYEFKHDQGATLTLLRAGRPVWNFHYAPADNTPYFDVLTVPGGPNMVAFMPEDHTWHRGLWFSWKYVNDINFWDWTEARGDRPKWPKSPPHEPDGWSKLQGREKVKLSDNGAALIEMQIGYGDDDKPMFKESRRLDISAPGPDGTYRIDWTSVFTPEGNQKIVFDRSPVKPTTGGYAGLSLRAPANQPGTVFTNSLGTTGQPCRGQNAAWVDMTALPDPAFGPVGVTIFDHPKNPRHPTAWHVQATPPFFYFNPALIYNEPYTLEPNETLTLHYLILVHKGQPTPETLNKEFKKFSEK